MCVYTVRMYCVYLLCHQYHRSYFFPWPPEPPPENHVAVSAKNKFSHWTEGEKEKREKPIRDDGVILLVS